MGDLEATSMHAATVYQLATESVVVDTKCVAKEKHRVSCRKDSFKGKEM